MSNKLQELTDRLYNEGLSKGKEEGEALLAKARKEADEIISNAKAAAAAIVEQAEKSAADLKSKAESDIKMASSQSLQATKKEIEELLLKAVISDKVNQSSKDVDFIKSLIVLASSKFCENESDDIKLCLSAELKEGLENWLNTELASSLNRGVQGEFSKKVRGGFTIGPKNGSWYVSFTDESFESLIAEYLRPLTRKILFG